MAFASGVFGILSFGPIPNALATLFEYALTSFLSDAGAYTEINFTGVSKPRFNLIPISWFNALVPASGLSNIANPPLLTPTCPGYVNPLGRRLPTLYFLAWSPPCIPAIPFASGRIPLPLGASGLIPYPYPLCPSWDCCIKALVRALDSACWAIILAIWFLESISA